jgi:hypothetical protein
MDLNMFLGLCKSWGTQGAEKLGTTLWCSRLPYRATLWCARLLYRATLWCSRLPYRTTLWCARLLYRATLWCSWLSYRTTQATSLRQPRSETAACWEANVLTISVAVMQCIIAANELCDAQTVIALQREWEWLLRHKASERNLEST